jgi:lipopolysaccharide/colanic/teichoic acid biosynthesis glycosyltransferase
MDDNMTVSILSKDRNFFYKLATRFMSIFVALVVIVLTLPITLISGILIKLEDKRKIFYRQSRVGKNSEHFLIWKLQSMKQNAEANGAVWAEEKDPRITKFGKVLRKLHIDEIPQMINILKGDISLVGPRPERPEFVEKLEKEIPYYFLRHSITPGFTGWAQIKYRYARTVDDSQSKFEYDLYYLKNRNIFLDFGIILKTVQIIFTH